MKTPIFIGYRYLTGKKESKFISFISFISIFGIALGVMALIIVLSVMGGFEKELKEKIIGTYPHLKAEFPNGISHYSSLMKEFRQNDSVIATSPYLTGEGIIRYQGYTSGVIIRGISPEEEREVTDIKKYILKGSLPRNKSEIMIGKVLAEKLGLDLLEEIKVVTPMHTTPSQFELVGIFESGMYEFDVNLVFINLISAQEIYKSKSSVNGIGIKVDEPYKTKKIKRKILSNFKSPITILSWQERNKNLFSALKLERTVMFIILTLIILVGCFSIMGTLIMMVMEKTKDIGILKSLGASNGFISKIFTYQGIIFGLVGAIVGIILGVGSCYLLSEYKFIKLPEDIYYIKTLPVQIQWGQIGLIALCAVLLSLFASIYPAIQAAKLEPAEALRYE